MGGTRSVEDRLRAEYAALAPVMRRTLTAIETEVAYLLLGPTLELHLYEQILVRGRIKECESAIALRRRQEGAVFDETRPQTYMLSSLPDLVGVRILAFPRQRIDEADRIIRARLKQWTFDPIPSGMPGTEPVAMKYHGFWNDDHRLRCEIQVVSLLIGLFWEVEHAAIYKPDRALRAAMRTEAMKARTAAVIDSLRRFEEEFGYQITTRDEAQFEEN
jgi:ppGpp synthetase/RelA/SpoT-type nucleotidyltranferase